MKRFLFFSILTFLIFIVLNCDRENSSDNPVNDAEKQKVNTTVIDEKVKLVIFNDVNVVISKLSNAGIGKLSAWTDDQMGGYMSLTDYYSFDKSSNNNLALYLESENINFVRSLKLVLNINKESRTKYALKIFSDSVKKIFSLLEITHPKWLSDAINSQISKTVDEEGYTVSLEKSESNIVTLIMKILTK